MRCNFVPKRDSFDDIKPEFTQDYLHSSMKNEEIRLKYDLSHGEFKSLAKQVKSEAGLSHRNDTKHKGRYYYPYSHGFIIQKRIDGRNIYFGSVGTLELAKKAVEVCEKLHWKVQECRLAIWELKLCK